MPQTSRFDATSRASQNNAHQWALSSASLWCSLFLCLLLTACQVTLIGNYDDIIDKGITNLQQLTEVHLATLKNNPKAPYDQKFYDEIDGRLAALQIRAAALPKYSLISQQLANLKKNFVDLQKLDRMAPRPLKTTAWATDAQSLIEESIEPILKLEIALKRTGSAP